MYKQWELSFSPPDKTRKSRPKDWDTILYPQRVTKRSKDRHSESGTLEVQHPKNIQKEGRHCLWLYSATTPDMRYSGCLSRARLKLRNFLASGLDPAHWSHCFAKCSVHLKASPSVTEKWLSCLLKSSGRHASYHIADNARIRMKVLIRIHNTFFQSVILSVTSTNNQGDFVVKRAHAKMLIRTFDVLLVRTGNIIRNFKKQSGCLHNRNVQIKQMC